MGLKALKAQESKRKISKGYMWALFCAVFWGIWYLPGTVVWVLNPFDEMYGVIAGTSGDAVSLVVTAALITAFNAFTVMLALMLWNGVLGKFRELGRTLKEFHPCSKWFFLASIFGGPIAILGSFMAMGFIGGAFAAVAALLYPVIGSMLAYYWYGEKISKRAATGIIIIILGGITIFGGGVITELAAGGVPWIGYLGGLMAAAGWGIEGAIAGKGLDISEPDVGLTLRFLGENIIWWIIIVPILAIVGYPMYSFALQAFEPLTLLVLIFAGITFGFCYVCWYKSFPLIGVGRGQGIGNLYGLCAIIFIFLFFGDVPQWTILVGGTLCVIGSFVMFTEETSALETLRGE
ncbi:MULTISPECIES: DMT family transporter [unclassified Methanosarcina]|uniref:DMT family transporter n=1 Tax=unclassified Methanosarcina TaxID=2644672 RepID=UPI000615C37D|nr:MULTISPECIES: DMT family transporter [unclassified Methanosarcina]AKB19405.1 Choline permease LicB [Methanosarcina sp. WWM596]AKB22773.1 Choline permease LicB [Methanosarcina sp. WH1]